MNNKINLNLFLQPYIKNVNWDEQSKALIDEEFQRIIPRVSDSIIAGLTEAYLSGILPGTEMYLYIKTTKDDTWVAENKLIDVMPDGSSYQVYAINQGIFKNIFAKIMNRRYALYHYKGHYLAYKGDGSQELHNKSVPTLVAKSSLQYNSIETLVSEIITWTKQVSGDFLNG